MQHMRSHCAQRYVGKVGGVEGEITKQMGTNEGRNRGGTNEVTLPRLAVGREVTGVVLQVCMRLHQKNMQMLSMQRNFRSA